MTNQTEALAEPLVPGSDRHLHILLAAANLNLVVGDDFKSLMEFGRLVWSAALSSQPPAPRAGAFTDEEWQEIADEAGTIIWASLKRAIDAKLEASASLTGTAS